MKRNRKHRNNKDKTKAKIHWAMTKKSTVVPETEYKSVKLKSSALFTVGNHSFLSRTEHFQQF